MKFTLALLVLFVIGTCTSAYRLERRRGSGRGGKGPDGPGSGSVDSGSGSQDSKQGPQDICRAAMDMCKPDFDDKRGLSSDDVDVLEDIINDCETLIEENMPQSKREEQQQSDDCSDLFDQCKRKPDQGTPEARELKKMLREVTAASCDIAVRKLPKQDGSSSKDDDSTSGSFNGDASGKSGGSGVGSGGSKDVAQLLRELLRLRN